MKEPIPGFANYTNRDYVFYLANSTIDKYRRSKEQQVNFENATSDTNGGEAAAKLLQEVLDQNIVRKEEFSSFGKADSLDKLWRFIAEMDPAERTRRELDNTTRKLVSLIQFRKANVKWQKEDNDELTHRGGATATLPSPPLRRPQRQPRRLAATLP